MSHLTVKSILYEYLAEFGISKGHFIALSSKCYFTHDMETGDRKLGAKGCSNHGDLDFQIYLEKLYNHTSHKFKMRQLRMVDGTMSRTECEKSSISDLFAKFRVSDDMITCRPLLEDGEIL